MLYTLYMNMLVYAPAARSGLSEIAVFFTSTSFTRNHVCLHTRLLHMISRSFGCGAGRSGNVSVHLLTSFMLRSTCLPCKFYHVKHVLLEFTREVRRQNGRKITLGTQILDKCWDYCKDVIPNSVHTKNAKNKLLNAEIWNYVYQWKWRYNHRHSSWQMVPKVLKALCK